MQHIQGIPRNQMQIASLDDKISQENPVRFIDAFVETIDLQKIGFKLQTLKTEGRPSFESSVFLKVYIYGYLNGLRSSRKLEKECIRNIEMQWLLQDIRPNYHSISDFRKNNPKALKQLFKVFVLFLKDADLVSGEKVAVDGTKSRAHNSKKANFNQKKIDKHLTYIEDKIEEYLGALAQNDRLDNTSEIKNVHAKIERLKANKISYKLLEEKLILSGEPQISTTDADARALLVQGQVVEISYNMQAAVDNKHNLVVATHTINRNDKNALSKICLEVKENLQIKTFTVLADKGYHTGREIDACTKHNIITIVAQPNQAKSNENGTTPDYFKPKFVFNEQDNTYTCPQGETLATTGRWHKKSTKNESASYSFQKYRTSACRTCPVKHLCTARPTGREIDRTEFELAVEQNNKRYHTNTQLYRTRQEINEHIFGTVKRQWGYNHTNLIGLEKVNGEHSLIMMVYNIKRTINILGLPSLLEKLAKWQSEYRKSPFYKKTTCFKIVYGFNIFQSKIAA